MSGKQERNETLVTRKKPGPIKRPKVPCVSCEKHVTSNMTGICPKCREAGVLLKHLFNRHGLSHKPVQYPDSKHYRKL